MICIGSMATIVTPAYGAPTIDGVITPGEYPPMYAELNTVKTGVCPNDAYTSTVGRFYFAYDNNGVYIAIESLDAGIWGSSIGFWGDLDNGVGYSESYPDDITNAGGQFAGTSHVHEYYLPYNAADSSGIGNNLEWYADFVDAADGVSRFNLRETGTCFAALDYYKGTYLPGPTWTTTSYDLDGWTMIKLDSTDSNTGNLYVGVPPRPRIWRILEWFLRIPSRLLEWLWRILFTRF